MLGYKGEVMLEKKDLLLMLKAERDYAERSALAELKILRGILDRVEIGIKEGTIRADDGLQGNEWRLYKYTTSLERLNEEIENLENLD